MRDVRASEFVEGSAGIAHEEEEGLGPEARKLRYVRSTRLWAWDSR